MTKHVKPKDIDNINKEYTKTREALGLFNSWLNV